MVEVTHETHPPAASTSNASSANLLKGARDDQERVAVVLLSKCF